MIWKYLSPSSRETLLIVALHLCGVALGMLIAWLHHG